MNLLEIGANQFVKPLSPDVQTRRHVTAVQSDEESGKAKGHGDRGTSSPIHDHVTLSKEAQNLAALNNPTSKNNSFQQSPSPFDR